LEAAEVIAFEVLEPSLRSRGGLPDAVKELCEVVDFRIRMTELFQNSPTGRLILPTLGIAIERIQALENRLAKLEAEVDQLKKNPL
jgi:hypothetical protein